MVKEREKQNSEIIVRELIPEIYDRTEILVKKVSKLFSDHHRLGRKWYYFEFSNKETAMLGDTYDPHTKTHCLSVEISTGIWDRINFDGLQDSHGETNMILHMQTDENGTLEAFVEAKTSRIVKPVATLHSIALLEKFYKIIAKQPDWVASIDLPHLEDPSVFEELFANNDKISESEYISIRPLSKMDFTSKTSQTRLIESSNLVQFPENPHLKSELEELKAA